MSERTQELENFFAEKRQEIIAKFDQVLEEYDTPAPLTVVEAKMSYSQNPPSGVGNKEAKIIYEDDDIIVILK